MNGWPNYQPDLPDTIRGKENRDAVLRLRPCSAGASRTPREKVAASRPASARGPRRQSAPNYSLVPKIANPRLRFGSGVVTPRDLLRYLRNSAAQFEQQAQSARHDQIAEAAALLEPELKAHLGRLFAAAALNLPVDKVKHKMPRKPAGNPPDRKGRRPCARTAVAEEQGVSNESSKPRRPIIGVQLSTAVILRDRARRCELERPANLSHGGYIPITCCGAALLHLVEADVSLHALVPLGCMAYIVASLREYGEQSYKQEVFQYIVWDGLRAGRAAPKAFTNDEDLELRMESLREAVADANVPCILVAAGKPRERVLCANKLWYDLCEYDPADVEGRSFSAVSGFQGELTTEASRLQFQCLLKSQEDVFSDLQITNYTGRTRCPLELHIRVELIKQHGLNKAFVCSIVDYKRLRQETSMEQLAEVQEFSLDESLMWTACGEPLSRQTSGVSDVDMQWSRNGTGETVASIGDRPTTASEKLCGKVADVVGLLRYDRGLSSCTVD